MRRIGLVTIAFTILCVSRPASGNAGWTDDAVVSEINPTGLHYYLIRLPVEVNPSDCKDKEWFFQDYAAPGSKQMYATLFESLKSGLRVRVYVTGRCNLDGYSEISSVSASR
jgi:hypothetical protein